VVSTKPSTSEKPARVGGGFLMENYIRNWTFAKQGMR
jgi:hypothetical protein